MQNPKSNTVDVKAAFYEAVRQELQQKNSLRDKDLRIERAQGVWVKKDNIWRSVMFVCRKEIASEDACIQKSKFMRIARKRRSRSSFARSIDSASNGSQTTKMKQSCEIGPGTP